MPADNVISLLDRDLGPCPLCWDQVRFAENYVRVDGALVHLACAAASDLDPGPGGPELVRPTPQRGA